jgi:hypothetical protein
MRYRDLKIGDNYILYMNKIPNFPFGIKNKKFIVIRLIDKNKIWIEGTLVTIILVEFEEGIKGHNGNPAYKSKECIKPYGDNRCWHIELKQIFKKYNPETDIAKYLWEEII